jgi:tRNA A37 threonylcarbamoyladenosine dehydratase
MNNPPAFPGKQKALLIKSEHSDIAKEYEIDQSGMTLRDYFAAKAMQSLILLDYVHDNSDSIADKANTMADAMLKAREA